MGFVVLLGACLAVLGVLVWRTQRAVAPGRAKHAAMLQAAFDAPAELRDGSLTVYADGSRGGVPLREELFLNPGVWVGTPATPKLHLKLRVDLVGASVAFSVKRRDLPVGAASVGKAATFGEAFSATGDPDLLAAVLTPAREAELFALGGEWRHDDDADWAIESGRDGLQLRAPAPVADRLVSRAAAQLVAVRAAILEVLERRARGPAQGHAFRADAAIDGPPDAAGAETTDALPPAARRRR
jgi:hypothetical protein